MSAIFSGILRLSISCAPVFEAVQKDAPASFRPQSRNSKCEPPHHCSLVSRDVGSLEDWNELRAEATRAHNKRTASYLLGIPLLPDYLEEALAQFGHSCDE